MIVLAKASEPETFLLFPSELEENHSINLICKANVGSPQGTIKIWKLFKNNTSELVYVSNTTTNKTENCTEFLNVNATYTVTRDDNGVHRKITSSKDKGRIGIRQRLQLSVFLQFFINTYFMDFYSIYLQNISIFFNIVFFM